jgi:hypothetical protein
MTKCRMFADPCGEHVAGGIMAAEVWRDANVSGLTF